MHHLASFCAINLRLPAGLAQETWLLASRYRKLRPPMSDPRPIIQASMRALVARLGCFDAAAETINAALGGGCSKGTISKRMAGQLDWPLAEIMALEDALCSYPVSRLVAQRLARAEAASAASLVGLVSAMAKEGGEAVAAGVIAAQAAGPKEVAQAVTEIREAIVAMQAMLDRLLQEQGNGFN